jgi:hypothetical protein
MRLKGEVMPKWIKIALICLCAAAVISGVGVVAVMYIRDLPTGIRREFTGIEILITGENEYEILQAVDIRIDGRVTSRRREAFANFDGYFEVSGFEFTFGVTAFAMVSLDGYPVFGTLSYPMNYRGTARIETLGFLYADEDFSSIIINIGERYELGGGSSRVEHTDRFIVAPASDGAGALEMLRYSGIDSILSAR